MNWDVWITDQHQVAWLYCVEADTEAQAKQKGRYFHGRQAPRGTLAAKVEAKPS